MWNERTEGSNNTGVQGGWVKGRRKGNHPGLGASSNKQALATSRNLRGALPPFLVPKRIDRDRSGAIGERWAALALS